MVVYPPVVVILKREHCDFYPCDFEVHNYFFFSEKRTNPWDKPDMNCGIYVYI